MKAIRSRIAKKFKREISIFTFALFFIALLVLTSVEKTAVPSVAAGGGDWPTLAANVERTSWTSEEVRGSLKPEWYRPFEPYIPQKVQIIAANNKLYISTADGLYALDAANGSVEWVYATEFPLGHSPTIYNGVAYVGGLDHKIHAVNADTGAGIWTFEAGAGFETNPLVVGDKLYAGNRDGTFYAVYIEGPNTGQLAWSYDTAGPILFSAAYKDGVVFFASNDSFAYALNADTGALVWKSAKLPGAGFYSYWPVVYENRVIFSGSNAYGTTINWPGSGQIVHLELQDVYEDNNIPPGQLVGALGTNSSGDWVNGTKTINASRILDYFDDKPWRRTVFVLNRTTGAEQETAPVLWASTQSGTRYPPVIGSDGVLYQQNNYRSDATIARGHISGWQPGVSYITGVSSDVAAVDEPHAASGGGNLIYWNLCCDRQSGAFDITIPNTGFGGNCCDSNREWIYYGYNLHTVHAPGYNEQYFSSHPNTYTKPYASYGFNGGPNGVYGFHGDVNPPIPYNGRVYMHRSNAIFAFADVSPGSGVKLSTVQRPSAPPTNVTIPAYQDLIAELEAEVTAILNAGHLRPGFMSHGLFDNSANITCGDKLGDYWSNSAETIYTLLLTLPHLSPGLQNSVRTYIQNEYNDYPPYQYDHVGWATGAKRETFIMPPEIDSDRSNHPKEPINFSFESNGGWNNQGVWGRNPFAYYALWKYAEEFGNASSVWSASQSNFWIEFNDQPSDTLLLNMPLIHNATIAGYIGYLELEALAGQPKSNNVQNELNRLLSLRANNFTKNTSYVMTTDGPPYCRTLNIASNFMYLVPELAEYLRDNAMGSVTAALNEYEQVAPYWFVSFFAGGFAENAITPLYDAHSIFMAKALIMEESGTVLAPYLDVPVFAKGDLYYIHKLVMTIENEVRGFYLDANPPVIIVDEGEAGMYTIDITPTGGLTETISLTATDNYAMLDVTPLTGDVDPPGQFNVTLTDLHAPSSLTDGLWYVVPIEATAGSISDTIEVMMLVNPQNAYLPFIHR